VLIFHYSIRNDEELNKLFGHVTIAQGGVIPNIHSILLPPKTGGDGEGKKTKKAAKTADATSQ
jgi:histone H2A